MPVVVKSTTARDIAIAVIAAVFVLGFLIYGIISMSSHVTGKRITGKITAKHFTPQPEEQVTIGKGGLRERNLDGEYTFEVYSDTDRKTYTVWVDKTDYDSHQIGDSFNFLPPPGK